MKYIFILLLALQTGLLSQELKVKSDLFNADQAKGISVFTGNVNILKSHDELNASEVTIYTNKKNKPTKFIAVGNVSFVVQTKDGAIYKGVANKAIYLPNKKEYHFFQNVHLMQVNEKKEILGDEVILKTIDGKAYAKGVEKEPVIMIFDIADEKVDENTTEKEAQ